MDCLIRTALVLICVCATFLGPTGVSAQNEQIARPQTANSSVIYAMAERPKGLSKDRVFQVFVGPPSLCCANKSPIAGTYAVNGPTISFTPAFAFLEGQTYTIRTWRGALSEFVIAPSVALPSPEVLAIYPSGGSIPENTLRFYIEFSRPMMPHRTADFIALVDGTGTVDDAAFMTFKQEIWNADRTRLTLLMDPGRIKRGVAQNVNLGPALDENKRYALVVRAGWPAATGSGSHIASRYESSFAVSPPLRKRPSIGDWDVSAPTSGTRAALVVKFDRPFDGVQTLHSLWVIDAKNQQIPGRIALEQDQTQWTFTPDLPWRSELFQIVVDARLEDVAGNNFRDALDNEVGFETRDVDHLHIRFKPVPQDG